MKKIEGDCHHPERNAQDSGGVVDRRVFWWDAGQRAAERAFTWERGGDKAAVLSRGNEMGYCEVASLEPQGPRGMARVG